MSMVNITIDGQAVAVPVGSTIVAAAKTLGIVIPTLCHLEMEKHFTNQSAACRVCVVEIENRRNLAPACATEVQGWDGGFYRKPTGYRGAQDRYPSDVVRPSPRLSDLRAGRELHFAGLVLSL